MKGMLKFKFIPARNGKPQCVRRECRLRDIDPSIVAKVLADFIKSLGAAPGASERLAMKIFFLVSETASRSESKKEGDTDE